LKCHNDPALFCHSMIGLYSAVPFQTFAHPPQNTPPPPPLYNIPLKWNRQSTRNAHLWSVQTPMPTYLRPMLIPLMLLANHCFPGRLHTSWCSDSKKSIYSGPLCSTSMYISPFRFGWHPISTDWSRQPREVPLEPQGPPCPSDYMLRGHYWIGTTLTKDCQMTTNTMMIAV
jgi:hypothetical protein